MNPKNAMDPLTPEAPVRGIKEVGKRKQINSFTSLEKILSQADSLLTTVRDLRSFKGVCKKGLYRFRTFEEADQWMERMVSTDTQEARP